MADNDFFKNTEEIKVDDQTQTQEEQVQTIKVGEKEYSQEDLNRLVNLGEIGAEAEERYGVKIDKIWPNHQRTINEKLQLEQELNTLKSSNTPKTEQQLSDDQIAQQAKEQLNKLGFVNKDEAQRMVNDAVAGYRLQEETKTVIDGMVEAGYPKAEPNQVWQHMVETGIKDPQKAYKDLFEGEIEKVKEKKLASLKPSGFVTSDGSTAGSKAPAPQKVDSNNLRDALLAALPD